MSIKNLFRKNRPAAIDTLEQFSSENDKDEAWRLSLSEKAQSIKRDLQSTYDQLKDDPSDALVSRAIKLASRQGEIAALERAHVICGAALQERAVQRTRGPLKEALQSVVDELTKVRNSIAAEHSATAARFGIDDGGDSAALRGIDSEIADVRAMLERVDDMSASQLKSATKAVLSR